MTFNSDLYLVAATVLPVLFIALMLESSGLARAAIWAARREAREYRRLRARVAEAVAEAERGEHGERHRVVVGVGSFELGGLLALPALACLLLFAAGEVSAVLALDARHATSFEHVVVVAALIALPVALVAVAGATLAATAVRDLRGAEKTDAPE